MKMLLTGTLLLCFSYAGLPVYGQKGTPQPTPTPTGPTPPTSSPSPTPSHSPTPTGPCPEKCAEVEQPGAAVLGYIVCCGSDVNPQPDRSDVQICVREDTTIGDDFLRKEMAYCTYIHEEFHLWYPVYICDGGVGASGGDHFNYSECQAYTNQAACLQALKNSCATNECLDVINTKLEQLSEKIIFFCRDSQHPNPPPTQIPSPTPSPTPTPPPPTPTPDDPKL